MTVIQQYLSILGRIQREEVTGDEMDRLENQLEELYYELSDEELNYIESQEFEIEIEEE